MLKPITVLTTAVIAATWLANAQAQCTSDCDGNGAVAVNELITCVNVGLEALALAQCAACDRSGDGKVAIDELVAGVAIALGERPCAGETGTPTVAPAATPTATPGGAEMTHCCVPAYYVWACENRTVAECAQLGGMDKGAEACDPTLCSDLPPADGHGICCLPNAAGDEIECEDRSASACAAAGGVVKANGGACSPTTCADVPPPIIRCCVPKHGGNSVECEDLSAAACAAQGGANLGAGSCTPDPCNP